MSDCRHELQMMKGQVGGTPRKALNGQLSPLEKQNGNQKVLSYCGTGACYLKEW